MFVSLEQAAWPAPGEVRDLRVSLNAPVLLGPDTGSHPTRAALGWLPADAGWVIRLWMRNEDAPASVRAFDLPDRPGSPAARATALERAERFLAGLGFLFAEPAADVSLRGLLAAPDSHSRTSDPDPASEPGAAGSAAVRDDVRLTKFRRRGSPSSAAGGMKA